MGAKSEGRFSPDVVGKVTGSHALLQGCGFGQISHPDLHCLKILFKSTLTQYLGCWAAGMKGLYFLIVAFKFRLVTTKLTKAVVGEKNLN